MRISVRKAAAVVAVVATAAMLNATWGNATASFSFTRLFGADRYATAAEITTRSFGSAPIVVLTTGERFPDALAASYVAGLGSTPILLTRAAALPASTTDAMSRLGTKNVLIMGGTSAVSTAVENDLKSRNMSTVRISGADRYETARIAAESAGPNSVGTVNGKKTAVVASGENFPDALATGPIAYANRFPMLLTPQSALSAHTRAALQSLGIKQVLLPGGTAAVSSAAETEIKSLGIDVVRFAGANRMETATLVADWALGNVSFTRSHVNLARGDDFADALAGAPHAGREPAPIVLTQSQSQLGAPTATWLRNHAGTLESGHVLGGPAAVSDAVVQEATTAARTTPASTTTSTTGGSTTTTTSGGGTTTTSTTAPPASCPPGTVGPQPPLCFPTSPPGGSTTTTTQGGSTTTSSTSTSTTVPPGGSQPQFIGGSGADGDETFRVRYDEALNCATVTASDFRYKITEGQGNSAVTEYTPSSAQCDPADNHTVILGVASNHPPHAQPIVGGGELENSQRIQVRVVVGNDNNTVRDLDQEQQPVGDTVSFFVTAAPAPPTFTSAAASNGSQNLTVTYSEALDCASVQPSDYVIHMTSGTGIPAGGSDITPASASCSGSTVTLTLGSGNFQTGQQGEVRVAPGGVVTDTGGENQPSNDTEPFTVS